MVDCLFALHILEFYNEALHWFQDSNTTHFIISAFAILLVHNVDSLSLYTTFRFVLNDLAVVFKRFDRLSCR
jgi:hypothetical protein